MRLPKDILSNTYRKPNTYLCETDKKKMCELDTHDMNASLKFNSISELSFKVSRVYDNIITGDQETNPFYDFIEAPRLILLEGFGYFEIQTVEIVSDGIKEIKNITANSAEYALSAKYLEDFYVNTGDVKSIEVINASSSDNIIPVTLYNQSNPELSLLDLILQKDYGNWTIGHVDTSLQTLSRQFEIDRESIYDFLMNEVCEKFNCYVVFDTINNRINVYAESLTAKFIGDGSTNRFVISPPFADINTVSVDGYKTTQWEYDINTGTIILEKVPTAGARIEIVDGALTDWETDVFVSFDNLSQEININYSLDDLKTVLSVTYGDDSDIREVNFGLPYLTDISYYYTVDWMGQDLYDAYTAYLQKSNQDQLAYSENSQRILELQNEISAIKNKLSMGYGVDSSVNEETVGTRYVISGGSYPNYFYEEKTLPADYNATETYYKLNGVNVTEEKVHTLFAAIRKYFLALKDQSEPEIEDIATKSGTWEELFEELTDSFKFVESGFNTLKSALTLNTSEDDATDAIKNFLNLIWSELGYTPLEKLYLEPYKEVQKANASAGYSDKNSEYYWFYYPVTIMISSLEQAISDRQKELAPLESELTDCQNANQEIADSLLIANNFTKGQLIRLNGFLREDELQLDYIVETSLDDINGIFKVKQDAMESGRIELQKLCQPQLQFSMSMANIYALPEFEPIIDQFQLGKVIRVALRPDYIKQSRLLQVDMNFDDLSDFSCEFGELTNLRTQSDIHADLLSKAISAGKSVATNSSYWTRGSDMATSTDLKIQQGLLDATTQIKAIDGNQGVVIDKYGIHLTKKDASTGEIDPHQTWMTNNMILMSDDGFKTSRSALGQVTVDGNQYYGLIAEMVLSGYIEGSKIKGGTIEIGETTNANGEKVPMFSVDEGGNVTLNAATISGYTTSDKVNSAITQKVNEIKLSVEDTENGSMIKLSTDDVEISSGEIVLNGFVTFNSLEDGDNVTTINGAEINTGKINSADINSGTIKIGKYTDSDGNEDYYFKVDEDGKVTISAPGSALDGYARIEDLDTFSSTITNNILNLQEQIDGSITTWFEDGIPSETNYPASTWLNDAAKNIHLGDLYYDNNTGYCYRWQMQTSGDTNVYSWNRITDTDVTKALDDAKKAQDTADGKRRVFTATPYPPYDVGDLWAAGSNGDLKRCKNAKSTGSYSASDWESATKYTDDTRANAVKNEVITGLATKGETVINGDNITTGTISADRLDVTNIFAKDITATGDIFFNNGYYHIFNGSYTKNDQEFKYLEIGAGTANNLAELWLTAHNGVEVSTDGYINLEAVGSIQLESSSNVATINNRNILVGECGPVSIQHNSGTNYAVIVFNHYFTMKPVVVLDQPLQGGNILCDVLTCTELYNKLQTIKDGNGNLFLWNSLTTQVQTDLANNAAENSTCRNYYQGFILTNGNTGSGNQTKNFSWAAIGYAQRYN